MVEPLNTKAWCCRSCGSTLFSRIDAMQPTGQFGPSDHIRCVECKTVAYRPHPTSPSLPVVYGGELVDASDRVMIASGDRIGARLARDLLAHYDASSPLISSQKQEIERLTREREEARGKLALLVDRIVYVDSYGVPGSDFQCCHLCSGGGAPGIPFEHDERCPVRHLEPDYESWFEDIRATDQALGETEARAEAAESRVLSLEEALRKIAEGNLGDDPWQANYERIRKVAQDALSGEKP